MQVRWGWSAAVAAAVLSACGGGGGGGAVPAATIPAGCTETDVAPAYACQTGSTEPLYTYQWALKLAGSFFSSFGTTSGGLDLDVEGAHQSGVKGQNVRVLVLDDGLEMGHEDLAANVDAAMSYNFLDLSNDPSPPSNVNRPHGTSAAGIIGAAQNGKGVMGIAPRVTLGGANYLKSAFTNQQITDAYGGASWSSAAHVINASYGVNPSTPPSYDTVSAPAETTALRALPALRGGKGLLYVKSAGNEFFSDGYTSRDCPTPVRGVTSCENPAHDIEALETNVITVPAAEAQAMRASYSNVGSVNWVTGLGGEYSDSGSHGQYSGPTLFTTDQKGCAQGLSYSGAAITFLQGLTSRNGVSENPSCDYGMLNGTSAAAPTVSGVIALMLAANPNLSWRDVREILRSTARKIQSNFGQGGPNGERGKLLNLVSGSFTSTDVGTSADLQANATTARVEYGWQTNGAGYAYANAFGFGLVDAAAAVAQAKATTTYRSAALSIPAFTTAHNVTSLAYGRVTALGSIDLTGASGQVDAFQVRLSGPLCVGSVGVFVRSPAGTVSALSVPYNIYYKTGDNAVSNYGLSSYAFFGENKSGVWEIFFVSGTPIASGTGSCSASPSVGAPLTVQYRILERV